MWRFTFALMVSLPCVCAAEAPASTSKGIASPAAAPLIRKAVLAAGGEANLLGYFTFKDRVLVGEKDTGFGAKRESVLDAPHHSTVEPLPDVKDGDVELWSLRAGHVRSKLRP